LQFLLFFGWDALDDVCLSLLVYLEGFMGRTLFLLLLNRDNEGLSLCLKFCLKTFSNFWARLVIGIPPHSAHSGAGLEFSPLLHPLHHSSSCVCLAQPRISTMSGAITEFPFLRRVHVDLAGQNTVYLSPLLEPGVSEVHVALAFLTR
jgi:hypothetical protein